MPMLWLAVTLPCLPLASVASASDADAPRVLFEAQGTSPCVFACNAQAAAAGIERGMPLSAARALDASLQCVAREPTREVAMLRALARWAQQFTGKVSLQPPNALLLEVSGSLRLFGGVEALCQAVVSGLQHKGITVCHAIAPNPSAAWLLARSGQAPVVTKAAALEAALAPLSLRLLPIQDEQQKALLDWGMQTLEDCMQLPRAGLSRRLGPEVLQCLDQAFGRVPEPRMFFAAPESFEASVFLPEAVTEVSLLLVGLQRLLQQLCDFLRERGAGAQVLHVQCLTPFTAAQTLRLTLLQPSRDPQHLYQLWQERLERCQLQAPVEGLCLQVRHLLPLASQPQDLLGPTAASQTAFKHVLERVHTRLGADVIQQLSGAADHRPERASTAAPEHAREPADRGATYRAQDWPYTLRPAWLLPEPQVLRPSAAGPCWQGPLQFLAGPERIESGWWTEAPQRRDYYIAQNARRQRLWVYRDLDVPQQWYVHGFFS